MKIHLNIDLTPDEQERNAAALEAMYHQGIQRAAQLIAKASTEMLFAICPEHKRTIEYVVVVNPDNSVKLETKICCDKLLRETTIRMHPDALPDSKPLSADTLTSTLPRLDVSADKVKAIVFAFGAGETLEVPLTGKQQFRIGRRSPQHSTMLDIDLYPFKAEEMGVSRVHCAIEIIDNELHIVDLGSTNGTFLNGLRVYEPRPLRNGDMLRVGNLPITVTFVV
jgi:hypothetical protein